MHESTFENYTAAVGVKVAACRTRNRPLRTKLCARQIRTRVRC
jgi:hypothetical protein